MAVRCAASCVPLLAGAAPGIQLLFQRLTILPLLPLLAALPPPSAAAAAAAANGLLAVVDPVCACRQQRFDAAMGVVQKLSAPAVLQVRLGTQHAWDGMGSQHAHCSLRLASAQRQQRAAGVGVHPVGGVHVHAGSSRGLIQRPSFDEI